jgi:hypothetical protein
MRKKPRIGTIVRIPLSDGFFAYFCLTARSCLWLYGFVTKTPATGSAFFDNRDWKFGAGAGMCPDTFVDCGKAKISGEPWGENGYNPRFYQTLPEKTRIFLNYKYPYVEDNRVLSPADIKMERRFPHQWLDFDNAEEVISQFRAQMEIREVPPQFIDFKAMSGQPVTAELEPAPQIVELIITIPTADMSSDEPEDAFEEPLEEALSEADCGSADGSGTVPAAFEINITTTRPQLSQCLAVIRRVLKKAKAPQTTRIIEITSRGEIPHPLISRK